MGLSEMRAVTEKHRELAHAAYWQDTHNDAVEEVAQAIADAEAAGYERGVRDAENAISHWVFTADMSDSTRAEIFMNRHDRKTILALLPQDKP